MKDLKDIVFGLIQMLIGLIILFFCCSGLLGLWGMYP